MKTGVLLINLGTPKSYEEKDVKRYLTEFLLDPLVIDLPWLVRQVLVRGVIIPKKVKTSAKLYQSIWTDEGSPLLVYGLKVKQKLQEALGEDYLVELAMRYHDLKIEEQLEKLLQNGVKKVIFLPLFPQYAEATTGSIVQKILSTIRKKRFFPEFRIISHYEEQERMIEAYVENIQQCNFENYDHLILSFHGLPVRHLKKLSNGCYSCEGCCEKQKVQGCYKSQCYKTAAAIVKKLGIAKEKVSISFQSRLGKEEWIKPYTIDLAKELLLQGKKKVLVACPAFVADCIETLSEIAVEYQEDFKHLGGEELTLVPSLNDHQTWIKGLKELVLNSH
jgi:ferrochelatase